MPQKPHICVCVCTYKRPELLGRLLSTLQTQETEGFFDFSIIVVDNDSAESARQVVETCARQAKISISYFVEPEQNISLARNRAVAAAYGDFIGFIDDDEIPVKDWLLSLFKAVNRYGSDGILGPVLPHFEGEPPNWVLKGHLFDRPTHPTGHILEWKHTRTGNALLRRELFKEGSQWFDPLFGSGGEDRDFFRRRIEEGYTFAWSNEASVFELVPAARWKRVVMMKRALLRGKMALNTARSRPVSVLNSTVAVVVYTGCLPVFLAMGQHVFMKYLIKDCDHLGKLLAFLGIDWIKEKYVSG